jgi:hypothetical protein
MPPGGALRFGGNPIPASRDFGVDRSWVVRTVRRPDRKAMGYTFSPVAAKRIRG